MESKCDSSRLLEFLVLIATEYLDLMKLLLLLELED